MKIPVNWYQSDHAALVKQQWRRIYAVMAASAVLILSAAYGIKPSTAQHLVQGAVESTGWQYPYILVSRFGAYESPWNGVFALLVAWGSSPLQICAGLMWFKVAKPLIESGWMLSGKPLVLRGLAGLALAGVFVYGLVALPGFDSVFCRGCEQESMVFMLAVQWAGLVIPSAMLAAGLHAFRLLLSRKVAAD